MAERGKATVDVAEFRKRFDEHRAQVLRQVEAELTRQQNAFAALSRNPIFLEPGDLSLEAASLASIAESAQRQAFRLYALAGEYEALAKLSRLGLEDSLPTEEGDAALRP